MKHDLFDNALLGASVLCALFAGMFVRAALDEPQTYPESVHARCIAAGGHAVDVRNAAGDVLAVRCDGVGYLVPAGTKP